MGNNGLSKFLIGVVVLVAVGLGIYFGLAFHKSLPKLSSQQFSGSITYISGDYLLVKGYFTVDGKLYNEPGIGSRDVEVFITPETKFNETILYAPTLTELASTSGKWDMSTVKTEEISGSVNDLASTTSLVFVDASTNIFGQSKINAQAISYTIIKNQEITNTHELCEDSTGKYIGGAACMKKFNLAPK